MEHVTKSAVLIDRARSSASRRASRRSLIGMAALAFALAASLDPRAQADQAKCPHASHWVGTWSTSPMPARAILNPVILGGVENQTLRQIAHVSLGGDRVRVHISNLFGTAPLTIGSARVAIQDTGASIVRHTDREITFSRGHSVVVPPGQEVVSDAVALEVPKASNLAISLFVPRATVPSTWHEMSQQTTYVSPAGDYTGATTIAAQTTLTSYYWLSGVDVEAAQNVFSVVAFGDSITDGMGSTVDANHRWPDYLSARLNGGRGVGDGRAGVLNQGISGDRVNFDIVGPSARNRFDRDALDQPGVKYVVSMIGINDFGIAAVLGISNQVETADDVISGLKELISRAHARGLPIYGGTLTPFEGTIFPGYFTPENEVKRQAVNAWIRTSAGFDAVLDFDALLQDPANPTRLLPAYDSGDHLHPSDAGYQVMANAFDLSLFAR